MRLFFRLIFFGTGLVLVALGAGGLIAAGRMHGFAKDRIEQELSAKFGTRASVDSVRILPFAETLTIRGLAIYNPESFKDVPAMRFERIRVRFDAGTLLSDAPTIEAVTVEGTDIDLRYKAGKGTNLGALTRNASAVSEEAAAEPASGEAPEFVVKALRTRDAKLGVRANLLPAPAVTLRVAPFALENLSGEKTVTTGETSVIFLRSMLNEILTLKGLLRPAAKLLRKELQGL